MEETLRPLAHNHISVDCVVVGFDGKHLKVLLIRRDGEENGEAYHDMKLPGSLIYQDEDLDEAARRVLFELTGLKNVDLMQFKAFGSKGRTKNPKDVHWLERAQSAKVERIVTVAYWAAVKISRSLELDVAGFQAEWVALEDIPPLAFDHNQIIQEAVKYICHYVEVDLMTLFNLLPRKFTAAQLRVLYNLLRGKNIDARNFHKKMSQMEYVIPLEEKEQKVSHRAARLYRFDRTLYNRNRK